MKRCTKCGEEKESTDFYPHKKHKDGLQYYCKKCCGEDSAKYQKSERGKKRIKEYRTSGKQYIADRKFSLKNPERKWASSTLSSHRKKCIINITVDELTDLAILSKHCSYCGIELNWGVYTKKIAQHNSPSLDRIRAEKNISINNIAIVCHKCNCAKNSGTFEELLEYAERLLKFQRRI